MVYEVFSRERGGTWNVVSWKKMFVYVLYIFDQEESKTNKIGRKSYLFLHSYFILRLQEMLYCQLKITYDQAHSFFHYLCDSLKQMVISAASSFQLL